MGGGGVITILQSPRGVITILQSLGGGGYYNITGPLGEGGKENQANFIWHNQNHPIPPFLGNKERTPY